MENAIETQRLLEIRESLSRLKVLESRCEKLVRSIYDAKDEVKAQLRKFEKESMDVENMKKDSLSTSIFKLIGKFEGKVEKETQEMIAAKMTYDKACDRVKGLDLEHTELSDRIAELKKDKELYEKELARRENALTNNITSQASVKFNKLVEDLDIYNTQKIETEEAIRAAKRALSTAQSAIECLDSAENWATYDAWTRGGIISHMAKYEQIDNAQEQFNHLSHQIQDLKKELNDISMSVYIGEIGIDSTTRAIDFWFDNIFTDLSVRDKIRGDKEGLYSLIGSVNRIVDTLENQYQQIHKKCIELEQQKNELLINTNI